MEALSVSSDHQLRRNDAVRVRRNERFANGPDRFGS
jgi:hypothetical protein